MFCTAPSKWVPEAAYMGFKNKFEIPQHATSINRFSMLVAGMFCSIAISAVYAFSLITDRLTEWGYTTNDITTVSTVGMVVGYFTLPFGFIYDYLGPKPIFAIAIIMNVLGTALYATAFDGKIGHGVAGMAIVNAILNLGCTLFDMGAVLTTLSWFPLDRGLVIACMKTATGLGGSIIATLYEVYFSGDQTAYMYFLMAFSVVLGLIAVVVFYLPPFHMTGWRESHYTEEDRRRSAKYLAVFMTQRAPVKRFIVALSLLISTLIVVWVRTIYFVYIDPTETQSQSTTIIMIVLYVLLLLTLIPLSCLDTQPGWFDARITEGAEPIENGADLDADEIDAAEPFPTHKLEPAAADVSDPELMGEETGKPSLCDRFKGAFRGETAAAVPEPRTQEEVVEALRLATETEKIAPQFPTGFFRNIRRPTLIGMWIVGFCTSGSVIVVQLNAGDIYTAISENPDGRDKRRKLYVSLISIGSAVGRLVMSGIEISTQSKPADKRVAITNFYIVPPLAGCIAHILFLTVPAAGLIAPFLLAGFGLGFYAACEVLTARTIFSIDISKHYNSLFLFEMLSLIFMNRLLFGEIMTKNSVKMDENMNVPPLPGAQTISSVCLDRKKCLQPTLITLCCLGGLGVLAAIMLNIFYIRFAKAECKRRAEHRAKLEAMLADDGEVEDVDGDCDKIE